MVFKLMFGHIDSIQIFSMYFILIQHKDNKFVKPLEWIQSQTRYVVWGKRPKEMVRIVLTMPWTLKLDYLTIWSNFQILKCMFTYVQCMVGFYIKLYIRKILQQKNGQIKMLLCLLYNWPIPHESTFFNKCPIPIGMRKNTWANILT